MTLESLPGDTFNPGDLLNNTYRIEGILGRGGTSEVYLAKSEISGRLVALKVLNAEMSGDANNLLLMTREEEIRDVRHDAVVRYSENNRTPDNHVYLVMDYVKGLRLDEVMRDRDLSVDDLMAIAGRVAGGLVATHERGIIHRDLSPDNIILRDGKPDEAVIIDFGIARDTNVGAATIVGDGFAGKYAYAAPEQLSGQSDQRTDLYSLGALLLAAYRGSSRKLGDNLIEIVDAKQRPLDTKGVPEPLKSLIDQLTTPKPEDRISSAAEALRLIDPTAAMPATVPTGAPSDVTVIGVPSDRKATSAKSEHGAGRRTPLWLAAGAAALVAAGAGAYLLGLIPIAPSYPAADPFTVSVVKLRSSPPELVGHAPSEEAKVAFEGAMTDLGGTALIDLASGDLPDAWDAGVLELVNRLSPMEDWQIVFEGGDFVAEGVVPTVDDRARMEAAFQPDRLPEGLFGTATFFVGPRELPVGALNETLSAYADCGPLTLSDPPPVSFALGERVTVEGAVASAETAASLERALSAMVGDRPLVLATDVLNEPLCLIEDRISGLVTTGAATFPPGSPLRFSEGQTGEERPGGRFQKGENPVIDLDLPRGVLDGYLWITVVDVNGNAFHLLPNIRNPENHVPDLRATSGDTVRLSHPIGTPEALAFQVDGEAGQSKVLIFHASAPLFGTQRPTSESIAGFAGALEDRITSGELEIYSLTEDTIETE